MKFGKNIKKSVTAFHFTQVCILLKITMDGLPQKLGLKKKQETTLRVTLNISYIIYSDLYSMEIGLMGDCMGD